MLFFLPVRIRLSCVTASRVTLPTRYLSKFFSGSVPRYEIDMAAVNTTERLGRLRQLMQEHKVDVYSMHTGALTQNAYGRCF